MWVWQSNNWPCYPIPSCSESFMFSPTCLFMTCLGWIVIECVGIEISHTHIQENDQQGYREGGKESINIDREIAQRDKGLTNINSKADQGTTEQRKVSLQTLTTLLIWTPSDLTR